jgi:hypothetical protein
MVKRQVKQPLMSYRDVDGTWRHALAGEVIDVASDDTGRFDPLNYGADYTPAKPKGPAAQPASPTSRRTVKKQAAKAAGRAATPKKARK